MLDDVAVYAHVLSQAAIGRHHQRGVNPLPAPWLDWVGDTYHYDGDGIRVAANLGRGPLLERRWTVDATLPHGQVVAETDGLANPTSTWTFGHRRLTETTPDGDGYLLADQLASVLATTDTTGAVTSQRSYEPYGADQYTTGEPASFGYTGEHHDTTTSLYHLRARQYDPVPLQESGSVSGSGKLGVAVR